MKKLLSISLFLFLLTCNFVTANANIVFIDMDKVISISKPGSSILKQLNELNNKNLKNLRDVKNELKEKEEKIVSQKNILSKDEFENNINQLKIEIDKYNDSREQIISNFKKIKIANTNTLLRLINTVLTKYADENSISIVLQKKNLIIGKSEFDITETIIKIVNSDIKQFKIK